jgi:hypothetical protein
LDLSLKNYGMRLLVEEEKIIKKLDTLRKYRIFITKQIKTQMKNLHIILLGGLEISEDTTCKVMV